MRSGCMGERARVRVIRLRGTGRNCDLWERECVKEDL